MRTTVAIAFALWGCSTLEDQASGPDGDGSMTDPPGGGEVTYHRDIAPLLSRNCVTCHVQGGIGPMPLGTYAEVLAWADKVAEKTFAREMPPFGVDNSGACNTWKDARWLTDDEIATIGAWVDAGAPEGPAADPPPPPTPPAPLAADVTVDTGVEYTPDVRLDDDYRCFIVDSGITQDQFLTGYQVRPGDARVVHHIILFSLDTAEAEAAAQAHDDGEEGPGYTCFGGPDVLGSRFIAGWAPGFSSVSYPPDTGIRMIGGRKLVLQIHYNLASGAHPDRTRLDLVLAPAVTKEATLTGLGDFDMVLAPGQDYVETGTSYTVPALTPDLTVWANFPHMHKLGRTLRVDLERAGQSSCLIDAYQFDFHWQQFYFHDAPVQVKAGDTVSLRCGFDTSQQSEPVTWGEGTADEMCLNFFYVTQ